MRIKRSTFYAMRILCRIYKEETSVVTSREVAEKEAISQGVALKILRELSYAGMVKVHQGRGKVCGGFSLAKSIEDITLADVIVVLEGMDVGVNLGEAACEQERSLHRACEQINTFLEQLFSTYSLRQLLESENGS